MSTMTVTAHSGRLAPTRPALTLVAGEADRPAIPCAARPSTGFVHRDGACRCFAGGPAPEFAPSPYLAARGHLTVAP